MWVQKIATWPTGKYGVILADPPWKFETWGKLGQKRSPERYYPTQTDDWLKALPVADLAADDCVCFMWATYPKLAEALDVMTAWGFAYRTVAFTWIKQNSSGVGVFMGLGYWTRGNAEICLLGRKGNPKRKAKDVLQVIMSPRREHSLKPDEQYGRIERLVNGPYIELFARRRWPGWDAWGNEVEPITEQGLVV